MLQSAGALDYLREAKDVYAYIHVMEYTGQIWAVVLGVNVPGVESAEPLQSGVERAVGAQQPECWDLGCWCARCSYTGCCVRR